MHIVQNKDYVTLIMSNQSNCNNLLNMYGQAYSFFYEVVHIMYLKNINLFKMG